MIIDGEEDLKPFYLIIRLNQMRHAISHDEVEFLMGTGLEPLAEEDEENNDVEVSNELC